MLHPEKRYLCLFLSLVWHIYDKYAKHFDKVNNSRTSKYLVDTMVFFDFGLAWNILWKPTRQNKEKCPEDDFFFIKHNFIRIKQKK